jgi:hypothetical protein
VESDLHNISMMGEADQLATVSSQFVSTIHKCQNTGIKIGEHEKPQCPNSAFHEQ